MPISLEDLVSRIDTSKTALVFGAGASVPSGAPSGADLATHLWGAVAKCEPESSDLIDTASILVRNFGRRAVIDAVVAKLKKLNPQGGILGIPRFSWRSIYTTNFDRLVELSYKRLDLPVSVIRSNYDFTYREGDGGVRLYKMHGCVSQDSSLGDKASMILTDSDYEEFSIYRETIFSSLKNAMLEGDVLVIGQSLRDRHLQDLVKEVLGAKQRGAPGRLFVLVYNKDDLRAPLLEDKGAVIAFGGIDEFVHALANGASPEVSCDEESSEFNLPSAVVSAVQSASDGAMLQPNTVRMFNGSPASYADINAGSTFRRIRFEDLLSKIVKNERKFVVITGAAGVGKTTFGRQLLLGLVKQKYLAWEHRSDFQFKHEQWVGIESKLRSEGRVGVLFIDECTHFMRAVNQLADYLSSLDSSALRLVLTANSAQWTPRIKSKTLFQFGEIIEFSRLQDEEIHSLINLLESNQSISGLVHSEFKSQTREAQYGALRQKCSADMFVCLKNIFATESLDYILLSEYDDLDERLQAYYRYVAALQAVGMRVHRQLVIRMLGMPPDQVQAALTGLHGIVDEYDISPRDGIYGWTTRHLVIARKITEYKFSSLDELKELFDQIIDNINPSNRIELQSVRDLCDVEFGIGRLGEASIRRGLYKRLISVAPGERIPWHRLIRELLEEGDLEQVEFAIRDAQDSVGADAPIDRYKVRLLIARSAKTRGISDADRLALMRKAYELAKRNTEIHALDKHSYTTLCDVAHQLVQAGENPYILDEAINRLRIASDEIFDPELPRKIQYYESLRFRR